MPIIKKLCQGLSLKISQDGHWLIFEPKDGPFAMLNLENVVEEKRIVKRAVLNWAKEIENATT